MNHLPSSSSYPKTTSCLVHSVAARRALGTRPSLHKISFQLGQRVFKIDICGMSNQLPASRPCRKFNIQFQTWRLACHCGGYYHHQDCLPCCTRYGLWPATTTMRWAHNGFTKLAASPPPTCPREWGLNAWNPLDKDAHCCWANAAGLIKVMCNPSRTHWHVLIDRSRKLWKPPWWARLVQQFWVCMTMFYLLWWMWRV